MRIRTLPVYSELADAAHIPSDLAASVPENWHLSTHQVDTYLALAEGDVDVVFNTAMTGDGKSLAAFLNALRNNSHVIALYPTNELIRDQANKMPLYLASWGSRARYAEMYSKRITQLMQETTGGSRVEQIRKLLEQNALLLTNPDLFHLMMNFKVGNQQRERKELPFEVPANFDYFVFDEFHVFGVPQIVDVVNVINYLSVQYRHRPSDRKRFLFLSATPHRLMQDLLAQSGLRVLEVRGQYSSVAGAKWRQILEVCDLRFDIVSQERPLESWVKEHLTEIVEFFDEYPGSKGAIIVNSVATAKRLCHWLKDAMPSGITVGENTGLTNQEERRSSLDKSLLIGTSTVDIGIDFRINLLIFEATGAGTFIQRFGRLGRHSGFGSYRAYSLLPKFILERLTLAVQGESEIERETFCRYVYDAYPPDQEFPQYARRWGILQTAHLVGQTEQALPKDNPFVADLVAQYDRAFGMPSDRGFGRIVRRYWAMTHDNDQQVVLDELTSFRGRSPLSCGLWDITDDTLKTYELFFVLGNTEFEVISGQEFMAEVHRRDLAEYEFRDQLLYAKVYRYVPEREHFVLGIKRDLMSHTELLHQIQTSKGFYVKESRQPWVDAVNRVLKRQQLVCVISDMPAREMKRRLWLPLLFPIYRLTDLHDSEFSVAFGKEALLLESLLFYRKTGTDKPIIM